MIAYFHHSRISPYTILSGLLVPHLLDHFRLKSMCSLSYEQFLHTCSSSNQLQSCLLSYHATVSSCRQMHLQVHNFLHSLHRPCIVFTPVYSLCKTLSFVELSLSLWNLIIEYTVSAFIQSIPILLFM